MGLKIIISILLLLFTFLEIGHASWTGPSELISGTWGSNPGQFGVKYGDTGDGFPRTICISSGGNIVIADENNSRVQTYKADGSNIAAFGPNNIPESEGWKLSWPLRLGCLSSSVYAEFDKYTQIYNMTGSLIKNWDNLQGGLSGVLQNDNFVTETSVAYYIYSPTGQLIKTSTTRPLELGVVKENRPINGGYRHIIEYPDMTYSFVIPWRAVNGYSRDILGNLYVAAQSKTTDAVYRISKCGKIVGQMQMPETVFGHPRKTGIEELPRYVAEYGSAVFAPNGDVYTWKRTPTNYSILKWTWVDDPNVPTGPDAPSSLKVATSTNGLYISWTASPQDPGCVTGYEISRATSAGGSGSTVGTQTAGKVTFNDSTAERGTTYYYKIRAVAGTEYSPFTSEVSGRRP